MADNETKPWPPAPENTPVPVGAPNRPQRMGWTSLGLAVVLLLVELFVTLAFWFAGDGTKILNFFIGTTPGHLVWWICAVVSGIMGRRTLPGKLGIMVSVIDLGLYAYLLLVFRTLTF